MKQENIAIFPGSFDPITKGHESIVLRALPLFDKIIVAIGDNTSKKSMFSLEKRISWLKETFKQYEKVEIDSFNSLTVNYCKEKGAKYILRGLRNTMDYQYEMNIARINNELNPQVETIFILTKPEDAAISSSFVREIITFGGDVQKFIPKSINITQKDINHG
ncbi:MAG: pantetheine-phosphate adenylyltransferase [Bacteroidales bacterium]|nr:pantetheine-phosphate adenylyltransferase [Bacteroidales bacterium]MBQ9255434.1 pantetheine-phosphate adenylyltransferase [Bacteroidales bacterium]